jgi:DNA-binding CsgD family transcriptional regulator
VTYSPLRVALDDVFVGRQAELARVADVVARARQGQPYMITIEGESGVGKTALARRCLGSSPGLRALWARADPSEADIDYGVIEQLLRGVDGQVVAGYPLLALDMTRSSPFAVGAQLLGVIGELQADGPIALVIDDVQWADLRSVEALSFMCRRLSVDPVVVIVLVRGDRDQLDEVTRRMLLSVPQRLRLPLSGLSVDDVVPLAVSLGAAPLGRDAVWRLHDRTGGHTLYLRTVLSDPDGVGRLERWLGPDSAGVPASLAAAIGDQLALLTESTRALLEMLAVLDAPMPLALLGDAARVAGPSTAIEPAVRAGLVDLWPQEPSRPVGIRHALQRDAIYASMSAGRRRELHRRAIDFVDEASRWAHRVAALDRSDEGLAAELEHLAGEEAARGHLALAATRLQWASDISPVQAERERRLLTAALHLTRAEEARALALRPTVEAAAPSPLRSCVLGSMAFSSGQLTESELWYSDALAEAETDPDSQALAGVIATHLAGTYAVLGQGQRVDTFGRWALATGGLDAVFASQARTLIAIGAAQMGGPAAGLGELVHLPADPGRVGLVDVDGLWWRGVFRLLAGDLGGAVADMTTGLKMVRNGATITLGLRVYAYLALAQYVAGAWDDVLITAEHGLSAAEVHSRRHDLPLLHLAAGCVAAGRGANEDAQRHASLAEQVAASLDFGQERLYAAMARALVCQASGDYLGMADALAPWGHEMALDTRSRMYGVLWRPLLVEGLAGSGQSELAAAALKHLKAEGDHVAYLRPVLVWLEGWLAEQLGSPEQARRIYEQGEEMASTGSPVYSARLLLAHGRLLRRTGQRRPAVERLRRAHDLYVSLGAAPFMARVEDELAACGLRQQPTKHSAALEMTNREVEVAHLVERGMTNAEIAAELYITPKAVEYHLGNIYAKFGLKGRQQLRRYLAESRRPVPA